MAKLTGLDFVHDTISNKVLAAIQKDAPKLIKKQVEESLDKGTDSKGRRFPEKTEATKKAYSYKGYNQTKWLVASGEGKKVKIKKTSKGIQLSPAGKKYMKYVKQSGDWFKLSKNTITDIINKIKQRLK